MSSLSKSGKVILEYKEKVLDLSVTTEYTISAVRQAVADKLRKSVHQIELREKSEKADKPAESKSKKVDVKKLTENSKSLNDYGIKSGDTIVVKDLGTQFSYRGVFVIEYLGPILIMAAFAMRPEFLFGAGSKPVDVVGSLTEKNALAAAGTSGWNSFVQSLGIVLWVAHFVKRELETFFLHKFSRPTMPLSNLFKNSMYYWGFALAVGFPLASAHYLAPANKLQVALGAGLWLASQTVNFLVHYQLANMRGEEGDTTRKAPTGLLFSLVSCPNYTAEVLGWVAWSAVTQVGLAYAFTFVGFLQMTQWALSKHKGYKADKDYSRSKKAIVPFII